MSYTSEDEIPFFVRRCFQKDDLKTWVEEYNKTYDALKKGDIKLPSYCNSMAQFAREKAFDRCKELPSSRYLKSIITTEVVDKDNEVADVNAYYDAMKGEFVDNGGGIAIDSHSSKNVSTIWKVEKGIHPESKKPCIYAYENYYRGQELYDSTWQAVLKGYLAEKSIGSRKDMDKTHMECDAKGCYTRLFPKQVFEVSSVFRGANPQTGIMDLHEAYKSIGNLNIVEMNKSEYMCPCRQNYLDFKADCLKLDNTAKVHHLSDGTIYVRTKSDCSFKDCIKHHYPDAEAHQGHEHGLGNITFIKQGKGEYKDLDVFDELMTQVEGEHEAIEGYVKAMRFIDSTGLSTEKKDFLKKVLKEIISDEQRHIGTLTEALESFSDEIHELLEEGEEETEEISEKSDTMGDCPPGQHRHAGVEGCHDETRPHPGLEGETSASPDSKAVMLASIPTEKLRDMLVSITAMLQQYPDDKIDTFLESPNGKKYMMLYAEFRRRKMSDNTERNTMENQDPTNVLKAEGEAQPENTEAQATESAQPTSNDANKGPIPETDGAGTEMPGTAESQGAIPEEVGGGQTADAKPAEAQPESTDEGKDATKGAIDLVQAVDNISAMLVFLKTKIETVDSRLNGLENMQKLNMDKHDTMADSVMVDVEGGPLGTEQGLGNNGANVPPANGVSDDKSADSEVNATPNKEGVPPENEADNGAQPPANSENPAEKPEGVPPAKEGEGPAKENAPAEDKPADKPADKEPPKADGEKPKASDDKAEPPAKKKEDDKLKQDWDSVDALKLRIAELESKGVKLSGAYEGNNLSQNTTALKASANVTLVDTPAPAFEMPNGSPDSMKGINFDDFFKELCSSDPKSFMNKQSRRYV